MQIWHRDVQPGIVQSSDQIISLDRHDSNDLSAHKLSGYALLLQPCYSSTRRVGRSIVMLKHEWMISVAKYVFYRIKVFWQCSDMLVHNKVLIENDEISTTMVANDTPLPYHFYWPCLDIRIYISPRLFSIPSPSRHNMQGWTLIDWRKVSRASCLVLSS